jgi:hypothetical protein
MAELPHVGAAPDGRDDVVAVHHDTPLSVVLGDKKEGPHYFITKPGGLPPFVREESGTGGVHRVLPASARCRAPYVELIGRRPARPLRSR